MIVGDTSAKMEGRDMTEHGYDALVEGYCVLLLVLRDLGEIHGVSKHALFVYYEIAMRCSLNVGRLNSRTDG